MPKQTRERRSPRERRENDDGPSDGVERRITPERRHPIVEFVAFDEHIEIGKTDKQKDTKNDPKN